MRGVNTFCSWFYLLGLCGVCVMGTNGLGKNIAFITASWLAARNSSTSAPCSQSATWIA